MLKKSKAFAAHFLSTDPEAFCVNVQVLHPFHGWNKHAKHREEWFSSS